MVVACWSAWYLGQYWLPPDVTSIDWKVFLSTFCSHWDHENHQRIDRDMAKWICDKNNNLVMHKLANLYYVINADGTPNKVGQVTKYVWAYVEIRSHKTT